LFFSAGSGEAALSIVGADGLAAMYALGRLHPVNRVGTLEERVDRISRALVYHYRQGLRRVRLNGPDGTELAFLNAEGELIFTSEGETVEFSLGADHPSRTDIINFEAVPADCTFEVCTNEGGTLQIACGDLLQDVGEENVTYARPVGDGLDSGPTGRVGWRIEATPEVYEDLAPTHLFRMRGDDGFTYKWEVERDTPPTPPTYPDCGS
jgi:hypothetical protein